MPNAKSITTLPNIHAIVYGESKTGKSTFAGTFPTDAYIFLTEPDLAQYAGKDFEYDNYFPADKTSWERIIDKIDEFQAMPPDELPNAIIVDSLTEIGVIIEEEIIRVNRREYKWNSKVAYDDKSKGMRIQDWGVYKSRLENLVRNLHALNTNTLMIAHEYVKQSGDDKVLKGCLSISGNFGETGTKLYNTVLRSRAETKGGKTTYFMQTVPERLFTAGVWGLSLPGHWENAKYADLEQAFKDWKVKR